ncbi:MAG: molybdenum cofactor guanylyltransferase [Clostridium sp.]
MNKFGSAVILAGGKSSRMGFDKKDLVINNERLLEILTAELRQVFDEVILVTNNENNLNIFDFVTGDIIESMGPLSGIYTGLTFASSKYVYVIACDMPIVNREYINYMIKSLESNENAQSCVTRYEQWIEPFNGFYSKELALPIKEYLGSNRRSIYSFLKGVNTFYIDEDIARNFSQDFKMFYNLNTKDDVIDYKNYLNNNNKKVGE